MRGSLGGGECSAGAAVRSCRGDVFILLTCADRQGERAEQRYQGGGRGCHGVETRSTACGQKRVCWGAHSRFPKGFVDALFSLWRLRYRVEPANAPFAGRASVVRGSVEHDLSVTVVAAMTWREGCDDEESELPRASGVCDRAGRDVLRGTCRDVGPPAVRRSDADRSRGPCIFTDLDFWTRRPYVMNTGSYRWRGFVSRET